VNIYRIIVWYVGDIMKEQRQSFTGVDPKMSNEDAIAFAKSKVNGKRVTCVSAYDDEGNCLFVYREARYPARPVTLD
jgi:hypothetical protein